MATTELKTVEKLVKEVLDLVKGNKANPDDEKSFEEINTKLDTIIGTTDNSDELIKKVEKLNTKIDKKSKDFVKEIKNALDVFEQKKSEMLSETGLADNADLKDFVAIITNEMIELKQKFEDFSTEFTDLNLNTAMATSKEIITMKNYVLSFNDSIEVLRNKLDTIKWEKVVGEPVSASMEEVFKSTLATFKDSIFSVVAKIMDGIDDISSKILKNAKVVEGIETSIGEVKETQQKNKDEIVKIINASISEENKKMLPKIMQIVGSISFDENAQEIKECIEEVGNNVEVINDNLGVLNQNIETTLTTSNEVLEKVEESSTEILDKVEELQNSVNINPEVTTNILEQVNSINETVGSDMSVKITKIKETLDTVTNDFNILTKGSKEESEEYVYTLLDLESDISKVRILLDDLTRSLQKDKDTTEASARDISNKIETISEHIHQTEDLFTAPDYQALLMQFDALNDDITSISKRTNKLILTSDDSSVKLEKNIADFQNILKKICFTVGNFEKSAAIKNISTRAENIQKMMIASLQSDEAINEAFIHLADWVDTTSVELENIKSEIATVNKKLDWVDSDDSDLSAKELMTLLKDTNKKLDANTKRMNSLEEKINESSAIKSSIDFLVAQVQIANENIAQNKVMAEKIESMEAQIQKLLSYVEEE